MKILVIGGYGSFGRLLVENLVQYQKHHIVVGGRSQSSASKFQDQIRTIFQKSIDACPLDIFSNDFKHTLSRLQPDVVVNACGPYQYQRDTKSNYVVARTCVEVGCHYIDLADDREFVGNFSSQLSESAKKKQCMLITGASTVPGLSCAVIDQFADSFDSMTEVYFGVSPGNRFKKGCATVASILSYTGQRYSALANGGQITKYGWQNIKRYDFSEPLGKRWMANCQIPDLDLLPKRYPSLETVDFQAGLNLSVLHLGMWVLSGLARARVVDNLTRYSNILCRIGNWFYRWGSDKGGMFVQMRGHDKNGRLKIIDWHLIAVNGAGPNVPLIAPELIINKLARGEVIPGAMPCVGLFSLQDFFNIANRWGIYHRWADNGGRGTDD